MSASDTKPGTAGFNSRISTQPLKAAASLISDMAEKEWAPTDIFDVFGDTLARRILILASERPLSADELAEHLDVSEPTIYRRLNALQDYDLLSQQRQLDPEGNHYQTVETTLRKVVLEIEEGGYNVNLQLRQSLADQFDSFWSGLEESQTDATVEPEPGMQNEATDGDGTDG